MNKFGVISLTLLALIFSGCAQNAKTINGTWQARLLNPDGSLGYVFTAGLTQSSGSTVNVSSFSFNSSAPCFSGPLGPDATFSATGSSNGYQTGPFQMTIDNNNIPIATNASLTLNGNRTSDGSISGSWAVTGSGCPGSGSFTMSVQIPVDPPVS